MEIADAGRRLTRVHSNLVVAMKQSLVAPALFATFFLSLSASGATIPFDTLSYNFQLGAGGGALATTLNGAPLETFSDDFADKIGASNKYSAEITTLSTDANLDDTRFGEVSSNAWTTISLTGKPKSVKQDNQFFNSNSGAGSSALARYEMAAYLVSLYNVGQGKSLSNEGIQEAIWTLLDPKAEGRAPNPNHVDPTVDLEAAVSWYNTMHTPANLEALNSFLGNYEVVSDPSMKHKKGLGVGGFQEQIVDPPPPGTAIPEPGGGIWTLVGLFTAGGLLVRRTRGSCAA